MRIVVSADVHYRPRWAEAARRLARQVRQAQPDCFVLAGDVGHPLANFERGLALFADLDCPRLALAGNHDLWSGEHSSQELWDHLLEEAARRAGFAWLDRENVILGGLGICGTLGWYDYSARDPALPLDARDYFINKGMFTNDGSFVDWAHTDQAFARRLLDAFGQRLAALCEDETISHVLVATHVPPFRESLVAAPAREGAPEGDPASAYYGNLTLGRRIVTCPKVTHVVSGHTHHGGHWRIATDHGFIESYVVGSDYGQPACLVLDMPWVAAF
ncbi:MAG: metallophosphoesterase [Anaerolineae bacterium]|jgi:predicted phosphohydrolase